MPPPAHAPNVCSPHLVRMFQEYVEDESSWRKSVTLSWSLKVIPDPLLSASLLVPWSSQEVNSFCYLSRCSGLNEQGPRRSIYYVYTLYQVTGWSPFGGMDCKGLGSVTLLEEVCH